jgi:glycosyltransferase involved in cell wall biosynthesis
MKPDYEIVVFTDDWFGLPFSCKHLLKNFLPEIPLIWVETIGLRSPGFNLYDIKRSFSKLKGWFSKGDDTNLQLPDNLGILDPFQIPYNQYSFIRRFNRNKMINTLADFSKNRPQRKRVFLTTWPFLGDLVNNINDDFSIYYRVDDFSEFPGVNKNLIRKLESEIIKKVDLVVGSAENLANVDNKSEYLPHGVDYEHFSVEYDNVDMPEKLKQFSKPKIGFFGLLNSWLNLELIRDVARKNTQWDFIIIGPSQLPDNELPKASNMHYLGPVAYDELPQYAAHFDVALVPFKINELTISVNPLKLLEYFALGVPVVSTPLPEVVKYQPNVYIGGELDTISEAINMALAEYSPQKRKSNRAIAKSKSWSAQAMKLKGWIEEELRA